MSDDRVLLDGVREYNEGFPVYLGVKNGRQTIRASNEGGFNGTEVDLLDLIKWIALNRPELLST